MAIDFDGTDDKTQNNNGVTGIDVATISMACWINGDSFITGNLRFELSTSTALTSLLTTDFDFPGNAVLYFTQGMTASNGDWRSSTTIMNTGTWYHLCTTHNASDVANDPSLYVDGVLQTIIEIVAPTGSRLTGGDSISLGTSVEAGGFYDGRLMECGVWNRILNADEVTTLARAYSPLAIPNGLVIYVPLVRTIQELMQGFAWTTIGTAVADHTRIIDVTSSHAVIVSAAVAAEGSELLAARIYTASGRMY